MRKSRTKKILKRIVVAIGTVVVLCFFLLLPQFVSDTTAVTSFLANAIFSHNLHEVVPGKFYRSAQMPRDELKEVIRTNKIKTVLDLTLSVDRPDDSGETEEQAANAAGAAYVNIPLNAGKDDQLPQIKVLLDAYSTAELPILVHCSSGTHRAGLASAIWLLDQEKSDMATASEQLTMKYGFFQFERDLRAFIRRHYTLDRILEHYEKDTEEYKVSFRKWLDIELSEFEQLEKAAKLSE